MARPARSFAAACRDNWQAAVIYAWTNASANGAVTVTRVRPTTFGSRERVAPSTRFAATAGSMPASSEPRRSKPVARPVWPASSPPASTSGSPRSRPAARTFRTVRRSSSVSSNTSAAPADSPRCSSSSITTRPLAQPIAAGSSKPSAGSSARTSIKAGSSVLSPCGQRMNWRRSLSNGLRLLLA